MLTIKPVLRSLVVVALIAVLLIACQLPSSSAGDSGTDGGESSSGPSGEAGTVTLRIERSGTITGQETQWDVDGEFPITLYFDPDKTSTIFWTQAEGTAAMTSVDVGTAGITVHWSAIWDVEFEVLGAFNAQDCSVEISVHEVWAEGAEVVAESNGVVLEGMTQEFIIFTTNSYEYNNLIFPYGVGEVTKQRMVGNVNWQASFTISNLVVPEVTNCGTFDYAEETIEPTEVGN